MQSKLLRRKFNHQKYTAKTRQIEWHFTLDTWIEWWGEDIDKRGRKKGQLVMARKGDIGPYHPDNVFKCYQEDNVRYAQSGKKVTRNSDHQEKLAQAKRKKIMTPDGIFNSRDECAAYYKIGGSAVNYRIKQYPKDYFYMEEQ